MIYYKKEPIDSIDGILEKYNSKEFKSPFRSTIPLLVLFKQGNCSLLSQNGLTLSENSKFVFEHETPVKQGNGRPSCTDLMIISDDSCIAIEAKRTEGKYDTVAKWLSNSKNKSNVLQGWLDIIQDKTSIQLKPENIKDLPYQLIHRVASACALKKTHTSVIYLGFDLTQKMKEYYGSSLGKISEMLHHKIDISLICLGLHKSEVQNSLEENWKNKERDLSKLIKQSLIANELMEIRLI